MAAESAAARRPGPAISPDTATDDPGVVRVTRTGPDRLGVEAHLPRFDRLIDLADHIRLVFTQPAGGPPGWTPAEAALKALGVDRATLHAVAQRWKYVLPAPLLGLTLLSPDYHAISPEEWRSLGVAAPAPLPDRFHAVAAWARQAAAST